MKRRTVDYVKSILIDGMGGQVAEMICMVLRCQKNSLLNKQSGAKESEKIGIHAMDVDGLVAVGARQMLMESLAAVYPKKSLMRV